MKFQFSTECLEKINDIKSINSKTYKKIVKQLHLFQIDPKHPSLRLHKLKGSLQESWSISIEKNVRMLFYYSKIEDEKQAVFFDIGTHDQVYQ
jgi:addiction module RelE/StbE family toxin